MKTLLALLVMTFTTSVFASNFGMTEVYNNKKAKESSYDMDAHKYNYQKDDEEDN